MSKSLALSLSLCVAIIAACSPGSGGGSDGGTTNSGPCSSTVPAASGSCELKVAANLPGVRTGAAAIVADQDLLLVAGQTTGGFRTGEVSVNTIAGGALGEWRAGPVLPEKRTNAAAAFVNGKLYVFGGEPGQGACTDATAAGACINDKCNPDGTCSLVAAKDVSTDVFVSTKSDGNFGAFEKGTALPLGRTRMAAAAGTNAIYLVGGGVARGGSDAAVFIARLDGTGAITGYDPAGALPAARSSASAAVVNGRLFVVGGIFEGSEKSCSSSTIISAPIEAGGRLGSWSGNTSIPKPPQGAALAVSGNTLLLVGGISNYGDAAGSVLASTVEADGSLTQWKRIATLKDNRYGHGAAVVGGSLFVLGGNIDSTTLSSEAFSAKVSADGAASCN